MASAWRAGVCGEELPPSAWAAAPRGGPRRAPRSRRPAAASRRRPGPGNSCTGTCRARGEQCTHLPELQRSPGGAGLHASFPPLPPAPRVASLSLRARLSTPDPVNRRSGGVFEGLGILHLGCKGGRGTSRGDSQRLAECFPCTGPSAELGVFHLAVCYTHSNYCRRILEV